MSDPWCDPTITPALADDRCPDCGGYDWRPGPRGGLSRNIECRGCRSRFNIARHGDTLIFAERIDREDQGGSHWREDLFPR